MSNAAEFILSLVDKVSGPALRISQSINSIGKASCDAAKVKIEALGGVVSGLRTKAAGVIAPFTALGGRLAKVWGFGEEAKKSGKEAKKAAGEVIGTGTALTKSGTEAKKAAGKGIDAGSALKGMVAALAAAGAALTVVGGKLVLDAQRFKENTLLSFRLLSGSAGEGKALWADLQRLAFKAGLNPEKIMGLGQQLKAGGFSNKEIGGLIRIFGDYAAAQGMDSGALERLTASAVAMRSQKYLTGGGFAQLADSLGSKDARVEAYRELAKMLKIKGPNDASIQKQIDALTEGNRVGADAGLIAVMNVGQKKFGDGEVGGGLAKFAGGTDAMGARFAMLPSLIGGAIEAPAMSNALKFFNELAAALNPEGAAGGKIVAVLSKIGDAMGKAFAGESPDKLAGTFARLVEIVEPVALGLIAFGKAAFSGFSQFAAASPILKSFMSGGFGDPGSIIAALSAIGTVVGWLAGAAVLQFASMVVGGQLLWSGISWVASGIASAVTSLGGSFSSVFPLLREKGQAVLDWFKSWPSFMSGFMSSFVEAFVAGISGIGAGAQQLIGVLKSVLRISSPSRVMMDLGEQTAAGWNLGLSEMFGSDGSPQIRTPRGPAVPSPVGGSLSSARGSPSLNLGGVTVNVTGSDAMDPELLAMRIRRECEALLVDAARALGAAA